MIDAHTEAELQALEESLWRPETRFDPGWVRRIVHPDFLELGRSGRVYDLAAMLAIEPGPFTARLPLPGFTVREPSPGVALVTYVSHVTHGDGEELAANRSSLWVRHADGWRLHFHQGTPA
jgi:hypothetical protein